MTNQIISVVGYPVRLQAVYPVSFYTNGVMVTVYFWQASDALVVTPFNNGWL